MCVLLLLMMRSFLLTSDLMAFPHMFTFSQLKTDRISLASYQIDRLLKLYECESAMESCLLFPLGTASCMDMTGTQTLHHRLGLGGSSSYTSA